MERYIHYAKCIIICCLYNGVKNLALRLLIPEVALDDEMYAFALKSFFHEQPDIVSRIIVGCL